MHFSKRLLPIRAFCALVTLLSGAPAPAQQPADPPPLHPGVTVVRDIEYARTPEEPLLLDLYRPEMSTMQPKPLVVWIHGGAWRAGSKTNPGEAVRFVDEGYVVASIGYRLSRTARFPAQAHDVKAAIRWLRANAQRYEINPDKIGVWGASAGGHLVALLGTSGDVAELEGNLGNPGVSSRVQAVVDYFGPTNFLRMDAAGSTIVHDGSDSPESQLVGGPIQQNREKVRRADPTTYVSADDPPFLIVHGDGDELVPHDQSVLLDKALRKAGVNVTFHTVVGSGHGRGGEFGTPALFERVRRFFDPHLRDRRP